MRDRQMRLLVVATAVALLAAGCTSTPSRQPLASQPMMPASSSSQATSPATAPAASPMAGASAGATGAPAGVTNGATQPAPNGMSVMGGGSPRQNLSAAAIAGEKIYTLGRTPKGPVQFSGGGASVGNGACANCHGARARGGSGPMIPLGMLIYGGKMTNMPKIKYANVDQIYAAVTTGKRPDGSQLKTDMPRYTMSRSDFDELAAYLKRQ